MPIRLDALDIRRAVPRGWVDEGGYRGELIDSRRPEMVTRVMGKPGHV